MRHLPRPTGSGSAVRCARHDGPRDAEVQCTAMLEKLMVPEVGVESFAQAIESAASRLATVKEYPHSNPHDPGGTMRSLLR